MTDYQFYKRMGVCPSCRKNKIMGDEGHCPECKAWFAEHFAKKRAENKDAMNRQRKLLDRALYNKRKELGLCATCGAELIDRRFVTCRRCRERVKIYKARQKAKKL